MLVAMVGGGPTDATFSKVAIWWPLGHNATKVRLEVAVVTAMQVYWDSLMVLGDALGT